MQQEQQTSENLHFLRHATLQPDEKDNEILSVKEKTYIHLLAAVISLLLVLVLVDEWIISPSEHYFPIPIPTFDPETRHPATIWIYIYSNWSDGEQ